MRNVRLKLSDSARACVLALLMAAPALAVSASPVRADEVIHPWELLPSSLANSFGWPSLMWHATAVAVTPPLVYGADAPVQEWFQKPGGSAREAFSHATFAFGWVAPILVPASFYLGGLAAGESELATAGAAAVQAAAIQAVFVTTLKWLTDRAGPYPDGDAGRKRALTGVFRDSKDPKDFDWNPFDLKGGLRWPSGHTASVISVVSALAAFYPDEPVVAAVGYPIALAVGIGMIDGDYHWLSDVVAGALIGHIIGWSVGTNFRKHYDRRRHGGVVPESGVELSPSLATPLAIHGWF